MMLNRFISFMRRCIEPSTQTILIPRSCIGYYSTQFTLHIELALVLLWIPIYCIFFSAFLIHFSLCITIATGIRPSCNTSLAVNFVCLTSSNQFRMDHRISLKVKAVRNRCPVTRKDAHILTATSSHRWITFNIGDINASIFALEIVFTFSYNLNSISFLSFFFSHIAVVCTQQTQLPMNPNRSHHGVL